MRNMEDSYEPLRKLLTSRVLFQIKYLTCLKMVLVPDLSGPTKRSLLSIFSSNGLGFTLSPPSADRLGKTVGIGKDQK